MLFLFPHFSLFFFQTTSLKCKSQLASSHKFTQEFWSSLSSVIDVDQPVVKCCDSEFEAQCGLVMAEGSTSIVLVLRVKVYLLDGSC